MEVISSIWLSAGIGGISFLLFVMILIQVWKAISNANLDTIKNVTEGTLIVTLRDEIRRLSTEVESMRVNYQRDMVELKQTHAIERLELIDRVQKLESVIQDLQEINDVIKKDVIKLLTDIKNDPEFSSDPRFQTVARILSGIITEIDNIETPMVGV